MPTEIQTTRSIGQVKDLLEDYGVSPLISCKLAVRINEVYEPMNPDPMPDYEPSVRHLDNMLGVRNG